MAGPIRVLSIDGGGIRGIIPAMVLAAIEDQAKRPIAKLFDLIAGTSTGGILALGLTKPGRGGQPEHSALSMLSLYEKEGPSIFESNVWTKLRSMAGVAEERYPAEPIERVLREYFGDARLKDALTDVLVTSYEIERRIPWFFKSRKAKQELTTHDFPMWQVARATSAAPVYFEPSKIQANSAADYWALIDGGVFANNPGMCSFVEAKISHPQANDFLVVSLGTGEMTKPLPYDEAKGWGLRGWALPIINVIFDGVNDTVDYQLQTLLGGTEGDDRRYYRFQTQLSQDNDDMDDASPDNIRRLKLLAEGVIRDNAREITRLCHQLVS